MGAHRQQSALPGAAVLLAVAAAAATCAPPAYAEVPTVDWNPIIRCESGGNPTIVNGSGHAGLLQFSTSTWLRYGGGEFAPTAAQASAAEQITVANRAFAANGLNDWDASRGCWGSQIGEILGGNAPAAASVQKRKVAPKPVVPAASSLAADLALPAASPPSPPKQPAPAPVPVPAPAPLAPSAVEETGSTYVVQPGDTLWDIAPAHAWPALYQRNRAVVGQDPNLIYPGQRLRR